MALWRSSLTGRRTPSGPIAVIVGNPRRRQVVRLVFSNLNRS